MDPDPGSEPVTHGEVVNFEEKTFKISSFKAINSQRTNFKAVHTKMWHVKKVLNKDDEFLSVRLSPFTIFNCVDRELNSEGGTGSTNFLNTGPCGMWIRIHNVDASD